MSKHLMLIATCEKVVAPPFITVFIWDLATTSIVSVATLALANYP
jgi:hypothetical protein